MKSLRSLAGFLTGWSERNGEPRRQVAVLPVRTGPDGTLQVMLITSRETRRWVAPKGWPMKGLKNYEAAAREAYEEAGLIGRVGRRALGSYFYNKRLKSRDTVLCQVQVFRLEVRKQLKTWPEQEERECRWFSVQDAAEAVTEAGLAALIRAVGAEGAKARKAKVKVAGKSLEAKNLEAKSPDSENSGSRKPDPKATSAKSEPSKTASSKLAAPKSASGKSASGKSAASKAPASKSKAAGKASDPKGA